MIPVPLIVAGGQALLPVALKLAADFAPHLIGMLTKSAKAEEIAEKVIEIAKGVTGAATPQEAVERIQADESMRLEFQRLSVDKELTLARIDAETARLMYGLEMAEVEGQKVTTAEVNQTMRAEGAAEHWPTYSWRPAIGFAIAFNLASSSLLVLFVFGAVVCGAEGAPKAVAALPETLAALAAITAMAAPIVGVASWFRGKMQADPSIPTVNRG